MQNEFAPTRRGFIKGAALAGTAALVGEAGISAGLCSVAFAADGKKPTLTFLPRTTQGTAQGKHGPITVEVTFSDHSVDDIKVISQTETKDLSEVALTVIPLAILANQSLNVDTVSGATLTSFGIINAVADAAEKAGGSQTLKDAPAEYVAVQAMTPGTYTAEAYGKWKEGQIEGARHGAADPIMPTQVEVTVDETSILSVNVLDCSDTPGFKDPALVRTPAEIVDQQSIYVDTVTGATMTAAAITAATMKCLKQAGADLVGFAKRSPRVMAEETYDADLVIVGGGLTGTSAALRASELGIKTLIIEKTNRVSGTGACSSGPFAVQSKLALGAGINMTVDEAFLLRMEEDKGRTNAALVYKVVSNTGRMADWLQANWEAIGDKGMAVNPSNDPMNIMHMYGKGTQKFQDLYDNYILPAGTTLLFETQVDDIETDKEGNICAVTAHKQDGTDVTVNCKAVLFATGGFGGNDAMMEKYLNGTFDNIGLSSNVGAGINIMLDHGCRLSDDLAPGLAEFCGNDVLDYYSGYMKFINQIGFLMLDPAGARFMNEEWCITESNGVGAAAMRRASWSWVILTQADLENLQTKGVHGHLTDEYIAQWEVRSRIINPVYTTIIDEMNRCIEYGQAFKADTLEELGKAVGFDEATYAEAIADYKQVIADGVDPLFGKDPRLLYPLDEGPFYAVRIISPIDNTYNGIRINTYFQALDRKLTPSIKGLYVAGMDSGGYFTVPYSNFLGSSSSYCLTSGMLAAESIAAYLGVEA